MNKDKIKDEIIQYLEVSIHNNISKIDWYNHPLRVIQATKSLIGINIEGENTKLIEWMRIYCRRNNVFNSDQSKDSIKVIELVSLKQLKESFINNSIEETKEILGNLIRVSDGRPILEYMLELSMNQNGISFLMIRSIMKSNLFMQNSKVKELLYLSMHSLYSFKFLEDNIIINSRTLKVEMQLEILISLLAMDEEAFIRDRFYKPTIDIAKIEFYKIIDSEKLNNAPVDFTMNGRVSLLDYLNSLEINNINPELVLFFDSVRSLMYANKNINKVALASIVNNYIKGALC